MAERKGWPMSQRADDMETEKRKGPIGILSKATANSITKKNKA